MLRFFNKCSNGFSPVPDLADPQEVENKKICNDLIIAITEDRSIWQAQKARIENLPNLSKKQKGIEKEFVKNFRENKVGEKAENATKLLETITKIIKQNPITQTEKAALESYVSTKSNVSVQAVAALAIIKVEHRIR